MKKKSLSLLNATYSKRQWWYKSGFQTFVTVFNISLKVYELKFSLILIAWEYYINKYFTGFELAIRESRFADRICLFADHFKQFLLNSFFSLQRNHKVSVYTSSSTNHLYLTPKSTKLYTIFLHLDSILVPNPQWGTYSAPPSPLTVGSSP